MSVALLHTNFLLFQAKFSFHFISYVSVGKLLNTKKQLSFPVFARSVDFQMRIRSAPLNVGNLSFERWTSLSFRAFILPGRCPVVSRSLSLINWITGRIKKNVHQHFIDHARAAHNLNQISFVPTLWTNYCFDVVNFLSLALCESKLSNRWKNHGRFENIRTERENVSCRKRKYLIIAWKEKKKLFFNLEQTKCTLHVT